MVEQTAEVPTSPFPRLSGRRVQLRAPRQADYDWLYSLATSAEVGFRWRLRGKIPSPEAFVQLLWRDAAAQMVIERKGSGEPVGLVQLINADLSQGYGYLSVLIHPSVAKSGWPFEGVFLFVNYAFRVFNLRKLYFESLDFSFAEFASGGGRFFEEEGCLKEHAFYDGRYWDFHILTMNRERWERERLALADAFGSE